MTKSFDEILSATRDIGSPTPEQVDMRLQALKESVETQQDLFAKFFDHAQIKQQEFIEAYKRLKL